VFARESSMVLWWRLYAGNVACGRYASLEEVHRPRLQGDPFKRALLGGPRAQFSPPPVQNFGYTPRLYHPRGRFGPVRNR